MNRYFLTLKSKIFFKNQTLNYIVNSNSYPTSDFFISYFIFVLPLIPALFFTSSLFICALLNSFQDCIFIDNFYSLLFLLRN